MSFRPSMPTSRAGWIAVIAAGWAAVALAQALQGYWVGGFRSQPQQWWPTLGYVAAIYSIWLALTGPLVAATMAVERRIAAWWPRLGVYLALYPVVNGLHVLLFAAIYWPFYRSPTIGTRREMAEIMFVRNVDTNILLYAAVVGLTIVRLRWARPAAAPIPDAAPARDDALLLRNRGTVHRVPLDAIDWIGAAGDYSEIHRGGQVHLIEEPLASLADRLPAHAFARIHRGALVRIDRVSQVEPIGRGDACVRLSTGEELRLSRRFRNNLRMLLDPASAPARPAE